MKKYLGIVFLMAALLTTRCASSPAGNESAPNAASSQPAANPAQAAVKEIQNKVNVRTSSNSDYVAAQTGMTVPIGGSVQTGDNSRARVDLLPGGTIIRVGPNSLYTVIDVSTGQNGQSTTKIKLDFGQIWVLLKGGQLQVQTPSGVASVRGSLLGVKYDPTAKKLEADCLEGRCGLQGNQGGEVELTNNQSSTIEEDQAPSAPAPMTGEEIAQWINENPDAVDFFDGQVPDWLPTPDSSFDSYQEPPTDIPPDASTDEPADIPPTP